MDNIAQEPKTTPDFTTHTGCLEAYIEQKARADAAESRAEQAEKERDGLLNKLASIDGKEHLQTVDERDAAEDALSQAYFLIKGESPRWSNLFGHGQALEDIDDTQKCLRAEVKMLEAKLKEMGKPVTRLERFACLIDELCADKIDRLIAARLAAQEGRKP